MRRRTFLVSSTGVLSLLVGCTGRQASEGGGDERDASRPESATIDLKAGSFSPKEVAIAVGGTVTWKNTTDTDHEITSYRYQSDAKKWDFPESPIEAGSSVEKTFDEKGLYEYYSVTSGGQYSMCGAVSVGNAPEITSMC